MKNITITFLFSFLFLQISFSQNTTNYIPLVTSSPNESFENLKQLDSYFTGKQVIAMGESSHGTHEFFTMRHRIFKYLVLHHGFNTFFLEADYSNCLRVNRYIHGAEDDVKEITSSIGLWPWGTQEIADLISWMREYNKEHTSKLNFIGCDMQQINTTIKELDRIIINYDPSLIDSTKYIDISQTEFFSLKDKKILADYQLLLENKQSITKQIHFKGDDEFIYRTLLRHLEQIIEERHNTKFTTYRDLKMGENMLYHLAKDKNRKAFFWAHNGHIWDVYFKKKKKNKSYYRAGGVLKHELKDKYFTIAQEFDRGSFNAYYMPDLSKDKSDIANYKLGEVTIEPSIKNSIGEYFRNVKDELLFFSVSDFDKNKLKDLRFHMIGADFRPTKKNKHQTTSFYFGIEHFDAMILIKETTATKLLK